MTTSTVSGSQTLSGLVVSSGDIVNVLSGGTLLSAAILSGGSGSIQAGGIDSGSTIAAGGSELVFGTANGDIVAGLQIVSSSTAAGVVNNETIVNGGVVSLAIKTTSASNTTVLTGGALTLNGAISATNTVLSGGTVNLQSAKATLTGSLVFAGGGTLEVTGNTSAGSGDLAIISGFAAGAVIDMSSATTIGAAASATLTTIVSSGNTVATVSGGGLTDSYIFAGTTIGASLVLIGDGVGGQEIVVSSAGTPTNSVGSGATQSGLVVSGGGTLTVYGGGTIVAATILSGGTASVLSGGVDQRATVSAGGTEILLGSATGDSVFGTQTISGAAAIATSETVQSGGVVTLATSGASASGVTVASGGVLTLSGANTATNITIAGGTVNLLGAQSTLSGSLNFNGPGTLNIATVNSAGAGDQAVISGFYVGDTINLSAFGSAATLSTTTSGANTIATVTSGGSSETLIFAGAVASNLSLTNSGGTEHIAYAGPPTTTTYTPGDLVLSIYGNGAGTGIVGLDQAAPITLEQITTTGAIVSVQVLPQTTTVVNGITEYAISGEYQSASEGILTLSTNGQSLSILGYGVNATAFNATNAGTIYGTTALGQTTSLIGGPYTTVERVVANIGYNGSIDTSTSLSGIFNTNNPRSVFTVNGTTFYLAGQGNGSDGTEGVFLATDGASGATAIFNTKTDARDIAIVNGQLYVSVDSKLNGGGTIYNFGTTLPTGATTPVGLPGIGSSIVLSAGQGNSVNASAIGSSVNLSPEQYFFANPTTLYVADGGVPKLGGIGDGGLQKWSLVNGTWVLDYTLSQGLNQIANTGTSGTTGLVGLTGTIQGGNVILYTTNETVAETDPSYLYAITDTLAATTLPVAESFTLLETAAPGTLIRGVAFAPTASSTTPQLSSALTVSGGNTSSGLVVTSGGNITVQSGGTIAATTLLSNGLATIASGGVDSGTFVAHGATETVLGSATADTIDGTQIVSAATAVVSGEIVENGGALNLFKAGAIANNTIVNRGGSLNISGNAFANNTTISGGAVYLQSPKAVLSGSVNFVGNGGTIAVTSVTSAGYGDLGVISGFGATDVIDERVMGSGSTLSTTLSGGNVIATITSGAVVESFTFAGSSTITGSAYMSGLALVSDGTGGVELTYTPPAPVVITVSSGVTSSGLSINAGSTIVVQSGGTISNTTLLSGGSAVISAGGVDSATTVLAGGYEIVSGSASGDQIYGLQNVTTGPSAGTLPATIANETVFNGGTIQLYLKPDTATRITVSSGGSLLLSGNVSASNVILGSGAYMALQSPKAVISGGLTFSGPATLAVTAITSAGFGGFAVISGWGAGDIIDETLISATVATLSTTTSGGNTVETISGGAFPESFIFAGTSVASHISLAPDGTGGVALVYAACYGAGTSIRTPTGDQAIEQLRVGDLVVTASGEHRPVRWLGHRHVDTARHPHPHDVMPVRVRAHAFAEGAPSRDLILSPDHAVLQDGVLIPVRYLLNGATIVQEQVSQITWWHLELDAHDVVLAEGLPAESYLDTGNRAAFANGGPVRQLHPDFARTTWNTSACAELVTGGPTLARIRQTLLDRLSACGYVTISDPALRFTAAGAVLEPQMFDDIACLVIPDAADTLELTSHTSQPAAFLPDSNDWRRLGVAITGLWIDGAPIPLDDMQGTGWAAPEPGLRWTTGPATLRVQPGSVVELRIAKLLAYHVPQQPVTPKDAAARPARRARSGAR